MLIAILFSFNLHALSHINDDEHNEDDTTCELCLVTTNEDKVFIGLIPSGNDFIANEKVYFQYNKTLHFRKPSVISKKLYKSDFYNKPPPASIS